MKTNSSDGKKTIRGLLKKRVTRTAVWLLIITLFAWMLLPVFTEAMLPVLLKKYAGISTSALDIRRISPLGIDAASFSLGPGEKPSLEADSIRLDFSPSSLMSGKFTKLSIGGGIFRCSLINGKFIIPGLEKSQEKAQSAAPEQTASAPPQKSLLNCPGKMEIKNFILEIDIDGRIARIPVDISVKPDKTKWAFSLNARPFEKGNGIQAKGEFDPSGRTINIDSLKIDFSGSESASLLFGLKGIRLAGVISASGKISLQSDNAPYKICAVWKDASLSYSGAELKPLQDTDLTLSISGSGKNFNIELQDAAIKTGNFSAGIKSFKLLAEEKNETLNISVPEIPISLSSKPLGFEKSFRFSAGGTHSLKSGKHDLKARLDADDFSMNMGKEKCSIKKPCLSVASVPEKTVIAFESGELFLPGGLAISSLNAEYPLSGTAWFRTGAISFSGKKLGGVEVSLETKKNQLVYKGSGEGLAFPGVAFSFTGRTFLTGTPGDTVIDYVLEAKDLSVINPGDFHKKGEGFELKGALACKGTLAFKPGMGLSLPLSVNIDGMRIENKEKKILAEGVKLVFFVPDLLELNGAGRQRLTFQNVTAGNFKLGSGIVLFRMEPQNACFIEKFEAKCSEGSIAFHALKIIPGIPDYRTVLFCNRLKFADVMTQLGILKEAEGKGTVSGRIPLVYYKGTLSVEDGFLYSSPGDGGRIRLSSPDVLSPEIIGEDLASSVQAASIELTRQALTAFDYQWAKLSIRSEGEILLVSLSLYGKPAKPLLFTYKEDLGGYVKVKSEEEGSIFTDMMLEFNFRLPVNTMIGYGNGIWRIFNEFKNLKPGAFK